MKKGLTFFVACLILSFSYCNTYATSFLNTDLELFIFGTEMTSPDTTWEKAETMYLGGNLVAKAFDSGQYSVDSATGYVSAITDNATAIASVSTNSNLPVFDWYSWFIDSSQQVIAGASENHISVSSISLSESYMFKAFIGGVTGSDQWMTMVGHQINGTFSADPSDQLGYYLQVDNTIENITDGLQYSITYSTKANYFAGQWHLAGYDVNLPGPHFYDLGDGKFSDRYNIDPLFLIFHDGDEGRLSTQVNLVTFAATPVPEPATMLLLGSGLIGLVGFRKKLKR